MELHPAIDLRGGRVVRLVRGDDTQRTVYDEEPVAVLERFAAAGIDLVHVVDLDAALGEEAQRALIEDLADRAARLELAFQLGGGLRDRDAVGWALDAGCERVVIGSMVLRNPDLFAELAEDYPGSVVPALDIDGTEGEIRIFGWQEEADVPLAQVCRRLRDLPCPTVLVTDIDRDGTMTGPNLELTARVGASCDMPALLSGGVHNLDDLYQAAQYPEIGGAVVGKALYEGAFTLAEALAACRGEGRDDDDE